MEERKNADGDFGVFAIGAEEKVEASSHLTVTVLICEYFFADVAP